MKHLTRLVLSCIIGIICLGAQKDQLAQADPYNEHQYPIADDLAIKKIIPPSASMPFDDYMIALAKAGRVNIIADVTSIPQKEQVQPFPNSPVAKISHWEPKLYLTLIDFSQQRKLSQLWYDPTTFIFWKEPDAVQLAHQLMARIDTDSDQKLATPVDLYNIVAKDKDLLQDVPKEGETVEISLDTLSPQQKASAFDVIQQLYITNQIPAEIWFSDTFWNKASLHLLPIRINGKEVSALEVLGDYHQDHSHSFDRSLPGLEVSK